MHTHTDTHTLLLLVSPIPRGLFTLRSGKPEPTHQHPQNPCPHPHPDRAGQGNAPTVQVALPNKASQARTCLGPEVEEKLPRLLAPIPELPGTPGMSPSFLHGPSARPRNGSESTMGPASRDLPESQGGEKPPLSPPQALGLPGPSWAPLPLPGHCPRGQGGL